MRTSIAVSAFIFCAFGSEQTKAQTCLDELSVDSPYSELVSCVKSDLAKEIAAELASTHVDALRGEKGEPGDAGTSVEIPSGAVLAFDRPDGCPDGWGNFAPASGRMLIGVDDAKYKLPYVSGLPEYQYGGQETHTLKLSEIPSHSHTFNGSNFSRGGWGGQATRDFAVGGSQVVSDLAPRGSITASGEGEAHENMPPYVALYFCKKKS